MTMFDENKFNEALQNYYKFKTDHKYYYLEWRTNSKNALDCKIKLNGIASLIPSIIKDIDKDLKFTVKVSSGASYFPRLPWIGVFFSKETPTNGVYPVLGFYGDDDGLFIGCTESIKIEQPNFSKEFHDDEKYPDAARQWEEMGFRNNNHIAFPFTVFKKDDRISRDCLVEAFKNAIKIYNEYRQNNSRNNNKSINDSSWYESKKVENVYKWLEELGSLDELQYIFRGQGFDYWSIESSLGVKVEYNSSGVANGVKLREKEKLSISEFAREVKRTISNGELGEVDIVSLMQHYGSSTRLVDFSYSPMVALFWAWEQNKQNINTYNTCLNIVNSNKNIDEKKPKFGFSPCIWAIKLESILQEYSGDSLLDKIQKSTENANKILKGEINASMGVDVVVPRINNERISSQDGLFLMARDIGVSFEENLKKSLKYNNNLQDNTERRIIKYVFTPKAQEQIDNLLKNAHVSYKTLYPDLTGLAKSVTARIMFK